MDDLTIKVDILNLDPVKALVAAADAVRTARRGGALADLYLALNGLEESLDRIAGGRRVR